MITPRKVRKGEAITTKLYNALVDAIIERTPIAGFNIRGKQTPWGVLLAGAASTTPAPSTSQKNLQLFDASTQADGPRVGVTFGTLGGLVPEDMHPGGTPPFTLSVSGEGVVYGSVTFSELYTLGFPESASIAAAADKPADSGSTVYITIGGYSVDTSGAQPRVNVSSALEGSQDVFVIITPNAAAPAWGGV